MEIRFYGSLAEVIGRQIDLDVPAGSCVGEVRVQLDRRVPGAAEQLRRARAIVADRAVSDEQCLDGSVPLEFLPPVSGG